MNVKSQPFGIRYKRNVCVQMRRARIYENVRLLSKFILSLM